MRRERERMFKRYVASKRHTMQVDFDNYLYELGKELKAGAARARAAGFRLPVAPAGAAARGRPARGSERSPLATLRSGRATKAQNRAAILEAAREVFAELGYDAAGVRDVIRRTDLASGTFYNYFPDKESVFRAVRRRERDRRCAGGCAPSAPGARTLEEFVGDAYRAWFEFLVEDRLMFELMQRNAGPIRALFGDPILGAGVEELLEDLTRGDRPGRHAAASTPTTWPVRWPAWRSSSGCAWPSGARRTSKARRGSRRSCSSAGIAAARRRRGALAAALRTPTAPREGAAARSAQRRGGRGRRSVPAVQRKDRSQPPVDLGDQARPAGASAESSSASRRRRSASAAPA